MVDKKTKIIVWDASQYDNFAEAEKDGATVEHMVPVNVHPETLPLYIKAYTQALRDAGMKIDGNTLKLQVKIRELKAFHVTAEVLEWNKYTTTVYAESEEDAFRMVDDDGIVTFDSCDVEWGITGVTEEDFQLQAGQRNIVVNKGE